MPTTTLTHVTLILLAFVAAAYGQTPPQLGGRAQNERADEILQTACTVSAEGDEAPRAGRVWDEEYAERRAYEEVLPQFFAAAPSERDAELLMPVEGVTLSQVGDTWGAARSEGARTRAPTSSPRRARRSTPRPPVTSTALARTPTAASW